MGKKRADSTKPDRNYVIAELEQNEEGAHHTSQVLCPCYAGWDAFENNVRVVLRQLKAGNRAERAYALHVFNMDLRADAQPRVESHQ
jgi:hypothetical protein